MKTNKREIIKSTIDHFDKYRFPKDVKNYKQYLSFNLDRFKTLDDWQANFSYPIGASIVDSIFANIFDFGYEFGVLEESFRKLLNETFDFKNQGRVAIKSLAKEALITGKAFVRPGLITSTGEKEILGGKYKVDISIKKPTMEFVSKFNVFYDHNYSLEDSPFFIIRTLLSGDMIMKKYKGLISDEALVKLDGVMKKNKEILGVADDFSYFSQNDFNPVKDILSYQKSFMSEISRKKISKTKFTNIVAGYFSPSGTSFTGEQSKNNISISNLFKFDKSKSYELIEYNEGGKVTIYVNGVEVGEYTSKLGDNGKIKEVDFNSLPGTSESLGVMDRIGDLQELIDSVWNSFIDNIKLQLSGMFKISGNINGLSGNTMKFKKFGLIRLNGSADVQRFEMGLGDFAPLNVVQYIEGFMSKASGVNDYQLGGQNKVERVTDGVDLIRSQYKSKLAVMIDSLQKMMSDMSRDWMMIYLTLFTEEELREKGLAFEEKDGSVLLNGIKLEKIISEESITFSYNALETIDMNRDREKISILYQALAQNGNVDKDELWNVVLGKKFDNIWRNGGLLKTEKEKEIDSQKLGESTLPPGTIIPDNPLDRRGDTFETPLNRGNRIQEVINTSKRNRQDPNNEGFNIEHTPSGAKVRKAIHNLTSTDITDKLSI